MENTGIVPTLPIGNSGFGGFGGDGIWALLIFAMIFSGGFGFGGGRPYQDNLATTDFVSSQFTQRDIQDVNTNMFNGFQNTNNAIAAGFGRTNDNLAAINTSVLENRYATQLAACQTQRDILTQTNELNTNILTTALQNQAKMDECCCSIKNAIRDDGEATRALITENTINALRSQVNDLKNTVTATNIGTTIINAIRPYPVPSWTVSSPYVSTEPAA